MQVRTALVAIACVVSANAYAQSYPTGPVRIVVPFPAGGGNDSMGRILAQKLTEAFGKQFVVENRGGANGMVGSELVARAAKDGYTLLVNGANFVTTPSLIHNATYDPIKQFEPISLIAFAPNVLVVHPSVPARTVKELIALAKARPKQVNFAGSGSGSTPHLAGELFRTMTNTQMLHLPYRGRGPAITGLLSGEVETMFMPALAALPLIKGGRVRGLAVTSRDRLPALRICRPLRNPGSSATNRVTGTACSHRPGRRPRFSRSSTRTWRRSCDRQTCSSTWRRPVVSRLAVRVKHSQNTSRTNWRSGQK